MSLTDLDTAARVLADALAGSPRRNAGSRPNKPARGEADELRARSAWRPPRRCWRAAAGPPLTELERRALARAAALLGQAGDHRRAALVYEELGDERARARRAGARWATSIAWRRRWRARSTRSTARRAAVDAMRRFETLLTGGRAPRRARRGRRCCEAGVEEAATAQALAARIDAPAVRGPGRHLRVPGGPGAACARCPPCLGRDRARGDSAARSRRLAPPRPAARGRRRRSTSRTPARAAASGSAARASTPRCPCAARASSASATAPRLRSRPRERTVLLEGSGGLDRSLRALVGAEPRRAGAAVPGRRRAVAGVCRRGARLLRRPDVSVRVDGQFIGPGCDLLHGDVIESSAAREPLRLEVE